MWSCKECGTTVSTRFPLLKNYRLVHGHFGRRHPYKCTDFDCPCVVKTQNSLHCCLGRSHANPSVKNKSVTTARFNCQLCTSANIASAQEYFYDLAHSVKCIVDCDDNLKTETKELDLSKAIQIRTCYSKTRKPFPCSTHSNT